MAREDLKITDRKISGEITSSYRNTVEQLGVGAFLATIDDALAVDGVTAIKWEQYTPYFNDGDECIFGVHEIRVQLNGAEEGGDYDDGFTDSWSLTYQDKDGTHPYRPESVTDEQAAAFPRLNLAPFEHVLLENFGDHAQIVATTDGFSVDYYEHE